MEAESTSNLTTGEVTAAGGVGSPVQGAGGLTTNATGGPMVVRGNNAERDNTATGYCTYDPVLVDYICKKKLGATYS